MKRTKHQVVSDTLREDILNGKYSLKLPSEMQLVMRFGVSRTTVQRALRDFEREGLIVKQRGRGSFVISQDEVKGC